MPNLKPGDTDPRVPLALVSPLEDYRRQALLESTRVSLTILMNELQFQSTKMTQAGVKTWWDVQKFKEIFPTGVSYQCKKELGEEGGGLSAGDCRSASFNFINKGEAIIKRDVPLAYQSGMR